MNINQAAIKILATKHKCIGINIDQFIDLFLKDNVLDFKPITDRNILKTGLYGTINECKIYCIVKLVGPKHFRTSELNTPSNGNDADWSEEISFDKYASENKNLIILT